MANFSSTLNPTPFAAFDTDTEFIADADAMVTFVKRKLGDDILSVELTKKQIWMCFEESVFEYGKYINDVIQLGTYVIIWVVTKQCATTPSFIPFVLPLLKKRFIFYNLVRV